MKMLTRTEEMILLAVWRLDGDAYGVSVREHIRSVAGMDISIGGIYVPLERLAGQGLLKSYLGTPTPVRGGMSKRFYKMTAAGIQAVSRMRLADNHLWKGLPKPKATEA